MPFSEGSPMRQFELLLACDRSGQISERQWTAHLLDPACSAWLDREGLARHLKTNQLFSYERLQGAFGDLFGLHLSQGALMNMFKRTSPIPVRVSAPIDTRDGRWCSKRHRAGGHPLAHLAWAKKNRTILPSPSSP